MSIRDLKHAQKQAQDEALLQKNYGEAYSQALRKLDEKLGLFHTEGARAIFESVGRATSLLLEKSFRHPLLGRHSYISYVPPNFEHINVWFRVYGTDITVDIQNYRYQNVKPSKNEILFGAIFKTDLDAGILPFDLMPHLSSPYSFTWGGMEDNSKVVNAIVQWLDKHSLPLSDFDSFTQ